MTAVAPRAVAGLSGSAVRGVAALSARLVRRGALAAPGIVALYVLVEIYSYQRNYPDLASRERLAAVSDAAALRILQGVPYAVQTTGGFVVWDGGWVLGLGLGIWVLLATTRLLRAEEDAGRAELVLAAPVSATRALSTQLLVLAGSALLAGIAAGAALAAGGAPLPSSLLYGTGLGGLTGTIGAIAAVTAQVLPVRRRAVGAAAAALAVLFVLRMTANSADSRSWLRWLTPFGWVDELRAFGDDRWAALLPLLAAPVLLGAAAVALRRRRDSGAGLLLAGSDRHRGRPWLLGSAPAFAWRTNQGVLLGWVAAVGVYSAVLGTLVKTVTDFIAGDASYRRILESFGVTLTDPTKSIVALLGGTLGVAFALYACWRVGAVRDEEASGRADHLLSRPVRRTRWLGVHVLLTLLASTLVAAAAGLALWAGAAATGAGVGLADALGSTLASVPAVALFGGIAVLIFGVAPRLTVTLSVAVTVLAYLTELLGPAIGLPDAVLDVSPFHHVAAVPVDPFDPVAAAVLLALASAAALLGVTRFGRRDVTGA